MKILYIEPYYGDSHRQWIESYQRHSNHDISILKLPGNKWKWRMHGGAITLAQDFRDMNESFDLILCSDFLNSSSSNQFVWFYSGFYWQYSSCNVFS